MGSPPSPDTALKASFTPSHHLKDRLLGFADFLLSNTEDWSNPQRPWPSPPPLLSFSGSDTFIKGRLPHRTAAIAASLSSNFSDAAPLPNACNDGDGLHHMQVDSLFKVQDVTHDGNDAAPAARVHGDGGSMELTNTQSETLDLSLNVIPLHCLADSADVGSTEPTNTQSDTLDLSLNENLSHPQADESAYVSRHDMIIVSMDGCLVDKIDCTHLQDAESIEILPSHDGLNPKLMVGNSQPDGLSRSFSTMDAVDKGLQNVSVEAPGDDLEEGELSERLSDEEMPNIMKEGEPETDEDMNESLSSFLSRRRRQSLLKLANQNLSTPATIRDPKKKRKWEEEQPVSEKALSASVGRSRKPEHMRVLQEGLSRVAITTDVNEGQRFSRLRISSTQVSTHGVLESIGGMDGTIGTLSKGVVQQGYVGTGQEEEFCGSSSFLVNEGLCPPTSDTGNKEELSSHKVAKKTKRGPLTEARKQKRQIAKHKASKRKLAKDGVCKLRFKPIIEKTKERVKKPCSFYVQGKCSKGASCTFSHDVTPLTKSEVCKYFIKNCCLKGDDCLFSHTLSTFPCKYFHMKGRCMEGEACRFSHEPMSAEAKQEFLQKIEEEQKVRQGVGDGTGWVGSNLKKPTKGTIPSDKPKMPAKGREAVMGFIPANPNDVTDHSKLDLVKKAASTFSSRPSNVANKSAMKSNSYDTTEPSRDKGSLASSEAMGMESGGQQGAVAVSSPGTTQERRTKAEVFLRGQLDESSRFLHGSRRATGLENAEKFPGSVALPMGRSTPIRVSSMSASCKSDAKFLDLSDSSLLSGHQGSASKGKSVENGAPVLESSPTLLDLLLRPQAKALAEDPASSSRSYSTDTNVGCTNSASNMFLNRFLK